MLSDLNDANMSGWLTKVQELISNQRHGVKKNLSILYLIFCVSFISYISVCVTMEAILFSSPVDQLFLVTIIRDENVGTSQSDPKQYLR